MRQSMRRLIRLAAILALASTAGAAEGEWTRFRGPNGSGISEAGPPCPRNGPNGTTTGRSSCPASAIRRPVVWGERIFVTSGDPETAKRFILCLHTRGRTCAVAA